MRLVKDARLSLPLTEKMKIARLTSPLLDVPRQSSPKPRLTDEARREGKALRSRARGYLSELHPGTCHVESHLSFCSPFSPGEFLAAASNLSPPLPLAQTKLPISC